MPEGAGALNPAAVLRHDTVRKRITIHEGSGSPGPVLFVEGFDMAPTSVRRCFGAVALLAALAAARPAGAADIRTVATSPQTAKLELTGLIQPGDEAKLATALGTAPHPESLELASLGGNVQAALAIGTLVRQKGLRTVVAPRAICASACGLVWLAGTPRVLGENAHVGLHAAYLRRNGISVETGAANALIGAYLGRLGFDDRAIVYLTSAAPDEMTWILPADRQRYGIAFESGSSPAVASAPAEEHFLSRPMALAGAIASAAVAAVDRLMGHHPTTAADR
jgi:hypothetical protein